MQYLAHAVFIVVCSFAIIALMGQEFYNRWAGFLAISGIPMMVMLNVFARSDTQRKQPREGLRSLCITAIGGAVVAVSVLMILQGQVAAPSIVAMMFVIFAVVMMMWLALVFGGWPATATGLSGWRAGLLVWILAYASAALLYPLLFDFAGLAPGAPQFQGWFPAWDTIVFCIATLGVIFALSLFEQMPLTIARRLGQPWAGLCTAVAVLSLAALVMALVTGYLDVDVVAFMVAGPVAFMFGVFMVTDVARGRFLNRQTQPGRGLVTLVVSAVVGLALYLLYRQLMALIAPGNAAGAPAYTAELWLANAMLSITFPVILIHMHFFDGWPLSRHSPPAASPVVEATPEKEGQAGTGRLE